MNIGQPSQEEEATAGKLDQWRQQRECAVACAVLAVAVGGAVLWSYFGKDWQEIAETREALRLHRELLSENLKAFGSVESAVEANERVLAQLRRARARD